MGKIKKALPFYIAMLCNFYLLPLLIQNTGSAMIMLLIAIPVVYGMKNGFHLEYAAIVAVLFIPSIFIFY